MEGVKREPTRVSYGLIGNEWMSRWTLLEKIKRATKPVAPLFRTLLLASHCAEAIAAVHGPVAPGDERNHGVGATLGADHGMHFPRCAGVAALLILSRSTTIRAALGLVGVPSRREELLLPNREGKPRTALHAG